MLHRPSAGLLLQLIGVRRYLSVVRPITWSRTISKDGRYDGARNEEVCQGKRRREESGDVGLTVMNRNNMVERGSEGFRNM